MAYKNISAERQWFRSLACLSIAGILLLLSALIFLAPMLLAGDYDQKVNDLNNAAEELNQRKEQLDQQAEELNQRADQLTTQAELDHHNTEVAQHGAEVTQLQGELAQHEERKTALESEQPPNLGRLPAIIGFPFLFGGVVQFFNGVRCLKARSAHQLRLEDMGNDARPPVLYLRPFSVDNAVMSSGARVFNPLNFFTYYKLRRTLVGGYGSYFTLRWTSEQVFEYVTRKLGPMVAIGQPDSPPVMGAYNLFVGEEWKERVEELAKRAQLVVLLAGATTEGLMWEMGKTTQWCDPEKLILFVPGGRYRWWWPLWRVGSRKRNWAAFRKAYESYCASAKPENKPRQFPSPLPERLKSAAFVGFEKDWTPVLLDPRSRPPVSQPRDYLVYRVMRII